MDYKEYSDKMKWPKEDSHYQQNSERNIKLINTMVQNKFDKGENKIVLNTNIKGSFPLNNINKLAAPLIESWAAEVFQDVNKDKNNIYNLVNVEVGTRRTDLADIILQFNLKDNFSTTDIDVKSTVDTIKNSGKGPNITSFAKIRSAYVKDPDFMFVILSIRYHAVSITEDTGNATGILQLNDFHSYDFKYLSKNDFSINPALGKGQIQIKDIHYVNITPRTSEELVRLLDDKYISSSKHTFEGWLREAKKNKWIK